MGVGGFHAIGTYNFVQFCKSLTIVLMKAEGNVTPMFLPHSIEILHYVYILFESWQGAQGEGLAIDLVFSV